MKSVLHIIIGVFAAVSLFSVASAETRIATWNVKRMTSENKDVSSIVKVLSYFDLIALQEVMDEESLQSLVIELQNVTGSSWGVMPSHAIGRGTYKERYAFIWRRSHIEYVDSALVYIDDRDVFAREPMSARFRSIEDDFDFIFSSVHILYGKKKSDRIPEIEALSSYWQWLGETYPDEQFFLAGDFNMAPDDSSYYGLRAFASPVVTQGATTLSTKNGKYANLYDNIWVPNNLKAEMSSGILKFPEILGVDNQFSRKNISDHAPVYLVVSTIDESTGIFIPGKKGESRPKPTIRGNAKSKIFHDKTCPGYDAMAKSKNLIIFQNSDEAVESGYRLAKNCG